MDKRSKKSKVGIGQIADLLNVSKSTVSRALNNHPKISQETKERVKQVAIKLGYTPNIPDLMAPEKIKTILVIVPEIETKYFREIIKGIQFFFHEKGFQILISSVNNSPDQLKSIIQLSGNIQISGIVVFVFNKTLPLRELLESENQSAPCVLVHQGDQDLKVGKVIPDIFQGVIKATNHLLKNGSGKIAMLLHSPDDTICFEMMNGYKTALEESGLNVSKKLIKYSNYSQTGIKENLNELFSENNMPDAIITRTPFAASLTKNYLKDNNLKVPEDVMIISLGSESSSPQYDSGIASIQLNGKEIGIDVSELLLEQIESPSLPFKTIIKPVNLIIKGSAIQLKKTN